MVDEMLNTNSVQHSFVQQLQIYKQSWPDTDSSKPYTATTKVVNIIANIRPELVRTFVHDQEQGHQQRVFHERRSGVTG